MSQNLTQIADGVSADPTLVTMIDCADVFNFEAGQFVVISDRHSDRQYFAQVATPQLNLNRSALGPVDNSNISAMEQISAGKLNRSNVVNEVGYYQVKLIRDITDGTGRSIRLRPQIASQARLATEQEVLTHLKLAPVEPIHIGLLIDSNIRVCMSRLQAVLHALIAGATGSGKSNTMDRLMHASTAHGACNFIFDHKPDYQNLHEPNDEGDEDAEPLSGVKYYSLGNGVPGLEPIYVQASDVDLEVLAFTLMNQAHEGNMADTLADILYEYANSREGKSWTLDEFDRWFNGDKFQAVLDKKGYDKRTVNAIRSKYLRKTRKPSWIDGPSSSAFGGNAKFNVAENIVEGRNNVILVPSSQGRSYGLFLTWVMRQIFDYQVNTNGKVPISYFIDEAQDIFCGSRGFANAVGGAISEHVRKGRSKNIAYFFGVQSADAVPEEIRNNLNSQFIHRHNNHKQAREAISKATDEQIKMTDTFGPGECLVSMFGATAVAHCQMGRAISNLTKAN